MSDSDATMPSLDEDPWIRFDTWAARSWESIIRATEIAVEVGPSAIGDDGPDGRVMAFFHAAEVAKEIAFAVNPNSATPRQMPNDKVEIVPLTPEMIVELLADDDDDD